MRSLTRYHTVTLASLLTGLAALTACVNSGQPYPGPSRFNPSKSAVITQAEIVHSHASTAYDAIQLSRPQFLTSRIELEPMTSRAVYLDGMRLDGIADLRRIPASSVWEIRYLRAVDAGVFGVGHPGGAILIVSKTGR